MSSDDESEDMQSELEGMQKNPEKTTTTQIYKYMFSLINIVNIPSMRDHYSEIAKILNTIALCYFNKQQVEDFQVQTNKNINKFQMVARQWRFGPMFFYRILSSQQTKQNSQVFLDMLIFLDIHIQVNLYNITLLYNDIEVYDNLRRGYNQCLQICEKFSSAYYKDNQEIKQLLETMKNQYTKTFQNVFDNEIRVEYCLREYFKDKLNWMEQEEDQKIIQTQFDAIEKFDEMDEERVNNDNDEFTATKNKVEYEETAPKIVFNQSSEEDMKVILERFQNFHNPQLFFVLKLGKEPEVVFRPFIRHILKISIDKLILNIKFQDKVDFQKMQSFATQMNKNSNIGDLTIELEPDNLNSEQLKSILVIITANKQFNKVTLINKKKKQKSSSRETDDY